MSKFFPGDKVRAYGTDCFADNEPLEVLTNADAYGYLKVQSASGTSGVVHYKQCRRLKPRGIKVGAKVRLTGEYVTWLKDHLVEQYCPGADPNRFDVKYQAEVLGILMAYCGHPLVGKVTNKNEKEGCYYVECFSPFGSYDGWVEAENIERVK